MSSHPTEQDEPIKFYVPGESDDDARERLADLWTFHTGERDSRWMYGAGFNAACNRKNAEIPALVEAAKLETLLECRGVAERELSYREHLEENAPHHRTHNPIVACKEIISAINVRIRAIKPSPKETTNG